MTMSHVARCNAEASGITRKRAWRTPFLGPIIDQGPYISVLPATQHVTSLSA
jgi:hypothetical protein